GLHAGPAERTPGSLFDDRALDQDASGQFDINHLLDGSLGPLELLLGDEIGLAFGGDPLDAEIPPGQDVGCETALIVGSKPFPTPRLDRVVAGSHLDERLGDGLTGVGGKSPALDDGHWLECERDFLSNISAVGLDSESLPGEAGVANAENESE